MGTVAEGGKLLIQAPALLPPGSSCWVPWQGAQGKFLYPRVSARDKALGKRPDCFLLC